MATLMQVYRQQTAPATANPGDIWVRSDRSASLCIVSSSETGGPVYVALGAPSSTAPIDPVQASSVLTSTNAANFANGDSVTVGTAGLADGPRTYTFRTALTRSTTVLTVAATAPADTDTVTIGSTTYRFKDTLASNNDVKRSATAGVNLTNLAKAIMDNGTPDTDYKIASQDGAGGGANAQVTSGTLSTDHITITAIQAGSIGHYATSAAAATTVRLTFTGTAMAGGVDDEVLISDTADNSLLALARLINGTGAGTEGTDYSRRGTTSEADLNVASSTSVSSHTITLTAKSIAGLLGAAGNSCGVTTASAGTNRLSFDAATLLGGVDGTLGHQGQVRTDGTYLYVCVADNTWKKITLDSL